MTTSHKTTPVYKALFLLLLFSMFSIYPTFSRAADLVIAENGKSPYQIVLPDRTVDAVVDRWLKNTANLMQTAFHKNGVEVPIVRESAKAAGKPGIYLGATELANRNNLSLDTNDWTYVQKVVGQDVVIVGGDRKNPDIRTSTGVMVQLALLGTVKGSLDFMREYMGVRFLFNSRLPMTNPDAYDKNGNFPLDTRSVGFIPVERVAIPSDLNLRKTPPLRARLMGSYRAEDFYAIANNYFPTMMVSDTDPGVAHWGSVIPASKYGKTHPEYFALMPNGKRASEEVLGKAVRPSGQIALDILNPDVLNLMYSTIVDYIKKGRNTVRIYPLDAYLSVYDTSERSNKFFGMPAMTMDQVRARGASGKLWQVYFQLADRLSKEYPQAKIIVLNYQDTPVNSKVIQKFPDNLMVQIQYGTVQHLNQKTDGVDIPAGIMGYEETFTGFNLDGPYAPERTPEYAAKMDQAIVRHKVRWVLRDGSMNNWGLQAPVYYVYGRMLDDISMNYQDVEKEFYTAAFGDVTSQMTQFFNLLHKQIDIYSDFTGLYQPAWTGASNPRYGRYRDNKWHHQSIYTVEFIAKADALLSDAERRTKDPDVKARLQLIRIDFDYLSGMGKIFALQDAWTLNRTQANLDLLLDAVDAWRGQLKSLAGGVGNSRMQPLKDWPQMRPFGGDLYRNIALERSSYQNSSWQKTALNWDTAAIRSNAANGKYVPSKQAAVNAVNEVPDIASTAWKKAPVTVLRNSEMPMTTARTSLQMLHDNNNLYVRIDSRIMAGTVDKNKFVTINKTVKPKTEKDIFRQEYAEVGIQPKKDGPTYRFAANPVEGIRYDAIMNPKEDIAWNGKWKFEYQINDGQDYPSWTAWFAIPYSDLGVTALATGESWAITAARRGMKGEGTPKWKGIARF